MSISSHPSPPSPHSPSRTPPSPHSTPYPPAPLHRPPLTPTPPSPLARRSHNTSPLSPSTPSSSPSLPNAEEEGWSEEEVKAEETVVHHHTPPLTISSPLHLSLPPHAPYHLTPLRSHSPPPVPSLHDALPTSPPPSRQDEGDNTFPVPHRTRPKRQNSVFAPTGGALPLSDPGDWRTRGVGGEVSTVGVAGGGVGKGMVAPSELRSYHVWQGTARFFCGGRLMAGPSAETAGISFVMILVPAVLFLAFPGVDLIDRFSVAVEVVAAVLLGISLTFLVVTSTQDPGVIPRREGEPTDDDDDRPLTQEVMMEGRRVNVKYCTTCRIYRPPRAVHCSICDACVERFDHHCPWLGTCVGRGNYRSFSIFLYTTTALLLWVMAFCILDMVDITREKEDDHTLSSAFAGMLRRNPISFILVLYCWCAAFFVVGLASFHVYLVSTNQTTNEQLKAAFPEGSPWSKGCLGNWVDMCRGNRLVEPWHRRELVYKKEGHQEERGVQLTQVVTHDLHTHSPVFARPQQMEAATVSGTWEGGKMLVDEHKQQATPVTSVAIPLPEPSQPSPAPVVVAASNGGIHMISSSAAVLHRQGTVMLLQSDGEEEKERDDARPHLPT